MGYYSDPDDAELNALTRLSGGFAGKRVLEIGCGRGRLTRKYAAQAAHVTAIDPDVGKIAAAREAETPPTVTYRALALSEFAAERPYDLVILAWSL